MFNASLTGALQASVTHRWNRATSAPRVPAPGSVHVWSAQLDRTAQEGDELRATLSPDELERASRFRYEHHARRFTAGRGILRSLIGTYLDRQPASISFRYESGKPALAPLEATALHFNLAHAGGLALYAFATATAIGVDVERVSPLPDARDVAANYFSPNEIHDLSRETDEAGAFYRCWTRKEAYIKAIGEGLAHPLDQFAVTLSADDPVGFRHIGEDPTEASYWSLRHLEPAKGYVGAVAMRAGVSSLDCWQWAPPGAAR